MGVQLNRLHLIGFIFVCSIAGCSDQPVAPHDESTASSPISGARFEIPIAPASDLAGLDADNVNSIGHHVDRVRSKPDDANAWAELARAYHSNLLYVPALETYAIAGQLAPRDPQVQYQMAIVLERLGRPLEAISTMEALHEWDERYAPGHRRLADWYRQQGAMEQALASAMTGMQLAPRDFNQRLVLGEILADNAEYAKGVKLLQPMLQMPNPHPYVYTLLGRCHRGLGQHELAAGMRHFAGPRPEAMADPWFMAVVGKRVGASTDVLLARGMLDRGDFDKAEGLYRSLRQQMPDDVSVVLNLSTCRLRLGDPDEAQQLVADYLKAHPADAQAMKRQIALAVHQLRSSSATPEDEGWDACVEMVDAFMRQHSEDSDGLVYRGEIERSRGRYALALDWFDRAAASPGAEADTYIGSMVDCLVELDRGEEAMARLSEVVEADPSDVKMTIRLAHIEAGHGRFESATARLNALQLYRPGDPAVHKALNEIGRPDEGG